jgi:hypothetical protein
MTGRRGRFRYDLLAGELVVLSLALWGSGGRFPPHGAVARFALYGALYSAALSATVRGPATLGRRVLFVVLGTLSSAATALIGFEAAGIPHLLSFAVTPGVILTTCAALGAAGYLTLVRILWSPTLRAAALPAASLGCALAVQGMQMLQLAPRAGGAWVAASWWFAFSLVLWYEDGLAADGFL